MPHIFMKNVEKQTVKDLSKEILAPLSEAIGCPADWITFNHTETITFVDGLDATGTAFVEVQWFPREQAVQDAVAKLLDLAVINKGKDEVIITFTNLDKQRYYEGGELC